MAVLKSRLNDITGTLDINHSKVQEKNPLVGIIMGSDSDLPKMKAAAEILEEFGVPFEVTIVSAHRYVIFKQLWCLLKRCNKNIVEPQIACSSTPKKLICEA